MLAQLDPLAAHADDDDVGPVGRTIGTALDLVSSVRLVASVSDGRSGREHTNTPPVEGKQAGPLSTSPGPCVRELNGGRRVLAAAAAAPNRHGLPPSIDVAPGSLAIK